MAKHLGSLNPSQKGVFHTLGSCSNVSILDYLWLPCVEDPYVHTHYETLNNQMVKSLLVTGEKYWDVDLVTDIFEEKDV